MSNVDESARSTPRAPASRRGRVRAAVLRALPAVLVLWAALALIAYGAAVHSREVLVEQKIEIPPELLPPMPFGLPPGQVPGYAVPPQTQIVPVLSREPALIREVTYGGVARTEDGELRRTYTGEAPSACPT